MAELSREAEAWRERTEREERRGLEASVYGACLVVSAWGGKVQPADLLPWLGADGSPVAPRREALTPENVRERFREALRKAGHEVPNE